MPQGSYDIWALGCFLKASKPIMKNRKALADHSAYIARVKSTGAKTSIFKVPCCGKDLEDRVPPKGETWDTLMACPHCSSLFFKVAKYNKIVGHALDVA